MMPDTTPDLTSFGDRLWARLEQLKLTTRDLAERLGHTNDGMVYLVRKGSTPVPPAAVEKWADALRYEEGTPERAEFIFYAQMTSILAKSSTRELGERVLRELLGLRAEAFALRSTNTRLEQEMVRLMAEVDENATLIADLQAKLRRLQQ